MAEHWFYEEAGAVKGPVDAAALEHLRAAGTIPASARVWRASEEAAPAAMQAPVAASAAPPSTADTAGFLRNVGTRISRLTDLPEITDVPVREILVGGLSSFGKGEPAEDLFAVGTPRTTPELRDVQTTWPNPRVFWRVLAGAFATYVLMRLGVTEWGNVHFVPGMIVVGAFMVPLAVVVFFFEMNAPRNVSAYQVGKMTLLGGALSLVSTMLLSGFLPGSGSGAVIPSLLTGVIEETAKLSALLLIVSRTRYRWQFNGALFGAAVGAGFAGFESAGYAFRMLATGSSLSEVFDLIALRAFLAPGGHVIWTAIVGSALWKARGDGPFTAGLLFHPIVLRRWCAAVVLHGIWDMQITRFWYVQLGILSALGWYLVFAVLKQSLNELEAAKRA